MEIEIVCYTAGIIDGEGSIGRCGNRFNVSVAQSEGNDGYVFLERLRGEWSGIGSLCWLTCRKDGREWRNAQWSIGGAWQVEQFLTAVIPHLRIKRARAEEVLAEVKEHIRTRRYTWSPEQDEALRSGWRDRSVNSLSRELRRGASGVRHRARKLGLPDKRGHAIRA